jgi:hypothetical protein
MIIKKHKCTNVFWETQLHMFTYTDPVRRGATISAFNLITQLDVINSLHSFSEKKENALFGTRRETFL